MGSDCGHTATRDEFADRVVSHYESTLQYANSLLRRRRRRGFDGEDLAQEAVTIALKNYSTLLQSNDFQLSSYLKVSAKQTFLRWTKNRLDRDAISLSSRKMTGGESRWGRYGKAPWRLDPVEHAECREDETRVRNAIRNLGAREKRLLILVYKDGRSISAAGRELGMGNGHAPYRIRDDAMRSLLSWLHRRPVPASLG